jgi:micrococcal nuclease
MLAVTLLLCPLTALAQVDQHFLVTRVVDGDTVDVERIGRLRLIGVDTPETVDPRRPVQFFGKEASDFLKKMLDGRKVRLEYDQTRKDAYNRTLAYLFLPDGTLVNAEIIRQGYGFALTRFPFRRLEEFRRLEQEAREAGRGLWAPERVIEVPSRRLDATPASSPRAATVYVTRTGTKYHAAGCRHLARSQIPMALADAARQFGLCAVCGPPRVSR